MATIATIEDNTAKRVSLPLPWCPAWDATATSLTVRFADVDMMQVMHHGAYVHWLEQIRFRFLDNILRIGRTELIKAAIGFPVLECRLFFHRSLAFSDEAVGYARVENESNVTFRFAYWIFKRDELEKPAVTGYTTHCYVDRNMKLLLRAPKLFADAFAMASNAFPECFTQPCHLGDLYSSESFR